jgi:branched-chain amino acid aminotransferase
MTPFDVVVADGRFVPRGEALFPPTDTGLMYGLGTFETLRLYEGVAFEAERHEERLRDAARRLSIPVPDGLSLPMVMRELAIRNGVTEARGRILLTGGEEAPDGSLPRPRWFAELGPLPRRTDADYAAGVSVLILDEVLGGSVPVRGLKTLAYLPNQLGRMAARSAGADEAILVGPDGELREGASSNLFLVADGALVTAPIDGQVLDGVTRGAVVEEARRLDIPVVERAIRREDLGGAQEAFLTSTLREVLVVRRLGDQEFDPAAPVARSLHDAYQARVRRYLVEASRRG